MTCQHPSFGRALGQFTTLSGLLVCACCTNSSQHPVSLQLSAAGTDATQPIEVSGAGDVNWQVELDQAQLAFGPLVLCPGVQAGDLCSVARAEWLGSEVIDALAPTASAIGTMHGFSGNTRSWMYDLGILSSLTQEEPQVLAAAEQLGGHSVILAGRALRDDGVSIPFRLALAIQQEEETETGVPVVRRSTSDSFEYDIDDNTRELTVVFDATPWLGSVDFDALISNDGCTSGGPDFACNGSVALTCDAMGNVESQQDCADSGGFCSPAVGCVAEVTPDANSQAARAVRNGIVAGERPQFVWRDAP